MTDDLEPLRQSRPDRLLPDDPPDPEILVLQKARLMTAIGGATAAADATARWTRVVNAIGTLPAAERQVLLLFAWEELSYDEIALALGIPVGTVRSRLSRGRARLAALTVGPDATTRSAAHSARSGR